MKRLSLCSLALLTVGCHEFEGELGQLGFASNLIVQADTPWTPGHPIAAETQAEFAAVTHLTRDDDEAPQVTASLSGSLVPLDPTKGHVALTGEAGDRGRVLFLGEATDRFSVQFAAPARVLLSTTAAPDVPIGDELLVMHGGAVALAPMILNAWDEALGFVPEDLAVEGCGARADASGRIHLAADRDCTLTVSLDGQPLHTRSVTVVTPDDLAALTVSVETRTISDQDVLVALAQGFTDDGVEILGLRPTWDFDADDFHSPHPAELMLPGDVDISTVQAHLDGLSAAP